MAYAAHTFNVNDVLTAAQMNQHEDNFAYLKAYTDIQRKVIVASSYQLISNTASETDICSGTCPGGTLGTGGFLNYSLWLRYLNNVGSNKTLILKIYYGATSLIVFPNTVVLNQSATLQSIWLDGSVGNVNNASVQAFIGKYTRIDASANLGYFGVVPGAGAIDSSANQTIKFTAQMGEANSSEQVYVMHAEIAFCPAGTGPV